MVASNRIADAIRASRPAFGTWAQMNCPEFCELAGRSGLDFVIIDMEHGSFGIEGAVNMIRAAEAGGATAMVRVPDASRVAIQKVLDAGAGTVLVPNVSSRAMAEEIVSCIRYAPAGTRGACPCTRASGHGAAPWKEHLSWCEDNIQVAVLIETPEGIRNFEEIIAVPGIDIVALGPFDLSQALGYAGDWQHPEVRRKQEELVRLARARGIETMPAVFDSDPGELSRDVGKWMEVGARLFAVSGDRFMLASGYRSIMSALRP